MTRPPLHLQLAGPAARPSGHPSHAFVLPELALGEYPTPEDARWLRQVCAIDDVVSLQDDIDMERKGLDLRALQAAYAEQSIDFHRVPVTDGEADALRARIDELVALLDGQLRAGRRVYLHCTAGLNRAPTVAIAYLHVQRGHALEVACDLVKAQRPCVPFMRMLAAHYGR